MSDLLRGQWQSLGWIVLSLVIVIGVGPLTRVVARRLNRSYPKVGAILDRARHALAAVLFVLGAMVVLASLAPRDTAWVEIVQHGLMLGLIAAVVWFLCAAVIALEEAMVATYVPARGTDDVRVRRALTNLTLLRRLVVAVIVSMGVVLGLSTFPALSAIGNGIFASAGIISIVAGLAAQSSLTNVFAGIQLALGDAVRLDDVIVVDGQSGTVDDLTLTYVVLQLWDDRRLILPSSYFISRPFENWTRTRPNITGSVLLDVDWFAPLDRLRAELDRVLNASTLWDGRTGVLRVVDATRGAVQLRIDLSAADTRTLFALQAEVREAMVRYLVLYAEEALPKSRSQSVTPVMPPSGDQEESTPAESDMADDETGRGNHPEHK